MVRLQDRSMGSMGTVVDMNDVLLLPNDQPALARRVSVAENVARLHLQHHKTRVCCRECRETAPATTQDTCLLQRMLRDCTCSKQDTRLLQTMLQDCNCNITKHVSVAEDVARLQPQQDNSEVATLRAVFQIFDLQILKSRCQ